jgi:Leucine-rich repeat (LRR) protein
MTNFQEYLNNQYSTNEDKKQVKEIIIDEKPLRDLSNTIACEKAKELDGGELDLSTYPNLETLIIDGNCLKSKLTSLNLSKCSQLITLGFSLNSLTELDLTNCPNLEELYCFDNELSEIKGLNECLKLKKLVCNANKLIILNLTNLKRLQYLGCQENQLKELNISENKELTELYCFDNELTNLNLNCPKLSDLRCNKNQLTQLTLPKLDNLQKLICHANNLTDLDFLNNCNPEKLEMLSLSNNNFPKQDLDIFTKFKELKTLNITGMTKPSYFFGSLKHLKKLEKLESLDIGGTNVTHGLEYLPESVKNFYCDPYRPDAKVIDIYEELQSFGDDINK